MAKLKEYTNPEIAEDQRKIGGHKVDKTFGMEILIKCADTSNVLKPFPVAKKWAVRVTDEFFLQGDMERANGIDVTPMCDRNTQGRVASQKGFVDFVIGPFYGQVAQLLPELEPVLSQIKINRAAWDAYDDKMLMDELGCTYLARLPGIGSDGPLKLRVATWNIAAVNNNPFEYWVTHQSDEYAKLMNDVQHFVDSPGERDFYVRDVLTDEMFQQLVLDMKSHGFRKHTHANCHTAFDTKEECLHRQDSLACGPSSFVSAYNSARLHFIHERRLPNTLHGPVSS